MSPHHDIRTPRPTPGKPRYVECQRIHFFDLPQKVLDRIFALAYPRKHHLRLIAEPTWRNREHLQPSKKQPRTDNSRDEKVGDWLVSKRFFVAAARAWVGNQLFEDFDFVRGARYSLRQGRDGGVVFSFARNVRVPPSQWASVRRFPNLEVVHMDVASADFNHAEKRRPWKELFDRDDFERSMLFCKLVCRERRPKRVFLRAKPCLRAGCELEGLIWEENVKGLEEIINERLEEDGIFLRRLREQHGQNNGCTRIPQVQENGRKPLYVGSKVYFPAERHDSVDPTGVD